MEIITLQNPKMFASNCYLLCSSDSFSVVDPSVSYEDALLRYPALSGLRPEYVLLTHGHVDHFWEIESYVKRGCRALISESDAKIARDPTMNCYEFLSGNIDSYKGELHHIGDGEIIETVGQKFEVIATPGHSAGSVSYLTDGVIFTGDTLFAGGVFGRYDLPTSDGASLLHSLRRLFSLNGDLIVYSGHGGPTTLKKTKDSFYNRRDI